MVVKSCKRSGTSTEAPFFWCDDYDRFWQEAFPNGPETVYIVGGNSDSSDASTSLCLIREVGGFGNWESVAKYILGGTVEGEYGLSGWEWSDIDCRFEEETDEIDALETPREAMQLALGRDFDPCILVRESDPMFQWLKTVRKWF